MNVVWTPRAAEDLYALIDYIRLDNSDAAVRVASRIFSQIEALATMPHRGRTGQAPRTRELVFHPWPYIAVYRIEEDEVRVLRIRHASQDWP